MKKPLRTFILVQAALDENEVPYLVGDPHAPSRRVGVERVHPPPANPDHFAEHFKPLSHVVDVTDVRHLAHFRAEAEAGTLRLIGPCKAADADAAERELRRLEAEPLAYQLRAEGDRDVVSAIGTIAELAELAAPPLAATEPPPVAPAGAAPANPANPQPPAALPRME